jgi:hypothetical protein
MERVTGDPEEDAFRVEMEVVSWINSDLLSAVVLASNVGTLGLDGAPPILAGASIDPDGRGGPAGGSDIGAGVYDLVAIHSGRGRGDVPSRLNDWIINNATSTFVQWSAYDTTMPGSFPVGSPIGSRSLLSVGAAPSDVPGFGVDALGDSAMDGGPGPYSPASPGGGPPEPGDTFVMDGFVVDIDDWDVGEVFSVNWFLAALNDVSAGWHPTINPFTADLAPDGQSFSYGVMNLVRLEPSVGTPVGTFPGAVFVGNAGFDQSGASFYDTVYEIPNPAEFAAEFGAGLTAAFLNPVDNLFSAEINTRPVPEAGSIVLVGSGLAIIGASSRQRRR